MSKAGKEVIIKAVMQAVSYVMSCFKMLESLCEEFKALIRKFRRGQCDSSKKFFWVSWNKICLPKKDDSLGFHNLKALTGLC